MKASSTLFIFFLIVSLLSFTSAAGNPAATYCIAMGNLFENYSYFLETSFEGSQYGVCILPNGESVDEWQFFSGLVGLDYSYCSKMNYSNNVTSFGLGCIINNISYYVLDAMNISVSQPSANSFPFAVSKSDYVVSSVYYSYINYSYWDWRDPPNDTIYGSANYDFFNTAAGGWVTPVKSQGVCDSCWIFASAGLIESRYKISNKIPTLNLDLSEQSVMSCGFSCGSWGSSSTALNYIMSNSIPDESCFPYESRDLSCSDSCSDVSDRRFNISSYKSIGVSDSQSMMDYLVTYGPLAVSVRAPQSFDAYAYNDSGIWRCSSSAGGTNHEVLFVGYNYTGNISTSYWIVKNSWGSSWGEGGYYKLGFEECTQMFVSLYSFSYLNGSVFSSHYGPVIQTSSSVSNGSYINPLSTVTWDFNGSTRADENYSCILFINEDASNQTYGLPNSSFSNFMNALSGYTLLGYVNWSLSCWEDSLGILSSFKGDFVLDIFPPIISFNNLVNGSYYNSSSLLVNLSSSENVSSILFGNVSNNYSYSSPIYFIFSEGQDEFYVYANDTYGNLGVQSILFYIDLIYPNFTYVATSGQHRFENFSINYTGVDNMYIKSAILETNASGNLVLYNYSFSNATNATANFSRFVNVSTYSPNFSYRVSFEDFAGNINSTGWQEVSITNTLPILRQDNYSVFLYGNKTINLSDIIFDLDRNNLVYSINSSENLSFTLSNNTLIVSAANDSVSDGLLLLDVNDSYNLTNFLIYFNFTSPVVFSGGDTGFDGNTTVSFPNGYLNIPLVFERTQYGRVDFPSANLTSPEFSSSIINISQDRIFINSSYAPGLNTSAVVGLKLSFNVGKYCEDEWASSGNYRPLIYKTEEGSQTSNLCRDCVFVSCNSTTKVFTFNVTGFSTYDIRAPSCSDGIQNQDETGVDCGGSCSACSSGGSGGGGGGGGIIRNVSLSNLTNGSAISLSNESAASLNDTQSANSSRAESLLIQSFVTEINYKFLISVLIIILIIIFVIRKYWKIRNAQ